jgi:sigma-B regulation protein RsbU (phosphoserine phosphatase)
MTIAADGTIAAANAPLHRLLHADTPLAGRALETILHVASRIFCQTHVFPLALLQGHADEVHLILRADDGSDVPVLANLAGAAGADPQQTVIALLPIVRRQRFEHELVEARRAAEEALRSNAAITAVRDKLEAHAAELDHSLARLAQRNAELEKLTDILFHDLREPVRKIATFTDMLRTDATLPAEDRSRCLARIGAAAGRAEGVLGALQAYMAAATHGFTPRPVALGRALAEAHAALAARGIALAVEAAALPTVPGHAGQLRAFFEQVLDNAAKFAHPDRPARVRVQATVVGGNAFRAISGRYREMQFLRIGISDNGAGFDQPLDATDFPVLASARPGSPGVGVGLALCKRVADDHQGSVAVASTPGVGTTITLTLPMHADSPTRVASPEEARP